MFSLLAGRLVFVFLVPLTAFFIATVQPVHAETKKGLTLVIPLYAEDSQLEPDYAAQLSEYIADDDILVVRGNPRTRELLRGVKKGKIAVIRQSLDDIERDISFLNSEGVKFDYICYNPEGQATSHTTKWEKENVIAAAEKARMIARRNNAKLIIVPDTMGILQKYGAQMARYADIFAIQFQRFQLLPQEEFRKKVVELTDIVRKGNPKVPIIAQISTNPPSGWRKDSGLILKPVTVDDMIVQIKAVNDIVDGVGFLIFKENDGLGRFKRFVQKIREP